MMKIAIISSVSSHSASNPAGNSKADGKLTRTGRCQVHYLPSRPRSSDPLDRAAPEHLLHGRAVVVARLLREAEHRDEAVPGALHRRDAVDGVTAREDLQSARCEGRLLDRHLHKYPNITFKLAYNIAFLSSSSSFCFERAIRKRPNTVRCLAVKSTFLGTRHPRKEKEAALQNVIGEPACLCGEITMCHSTGDGTKH